MLEEKRSSRVSIQCHDTMFHVEHNSESGEVFHVEHFWVEIGAMFHVEQPTRCGMPTRGNR